MAEHHVKDRLYYEECAGKRASQLIDADIVELPLPTAARRDEQWQLVKTSAEAAWETAEFFFPRNGSWAKRSFLELHGISGRSGLDGNGNWGVVIAPDEMRTQDGRPARNVASHIAEAALASGLVPRSVDKIACLPQLSAPGNWIFATGSLPVAVIYDWNGYYPAMVPRDGFEVSTGTLANTPETLHAWPGYVTSRMRPAPEAQPQIDAWYSEIWNSTRALEAANTIISSLVPVSEYSLEGRLGQDGIAQMAELLTGSADAAPKPFSKTGEATSVSHLSPLMGRNDLPMSAEAAKKLLDETEAELSKLADIVRIWEHFTYRRYRTRIVPINQATHIDPEWLEAVRRLGDDSGIYEAVAAYLDGACVKHICA